MISLSLTMRMSSLVLVDVAYYQPSSMPSSSCLRIISPLVGHLWESPYRLRRFIWIFSLLAFVFSRKSIFYLEKIRIRMSSDLRIDLELDFSLMHSLSVFYGISKSSSILEPWWSFLFKSLCTYQQVYSRLSTLFTSKTSAKILVSFYSS